MTSFFLYIYPANRKNTRNLFFYIIRELFSLSNPATITWRLTLDFWDKTRKTLIFRKK